MWEIFQSIGSIDKLKQKGSLQHYKKRLKKYQENEADILIDMGILCSNEEKYDESIKYLKQAQRTYYKLNYTEGRAFVFDLIGDVYLSMREMDKALDYYKKSFQMYASIRSPLKSDELEKIKEVEDIKEAIEIANAGKENAEISEEYSIEEVESSEETSAPENYVECHLGAVYYILGSKDKIYEVFKKSLEIFRDLKYKEGESAALDLMNTLYNADVCTDEEIISKV